MRTRRVGDLCRLAGLRLPDAEMERLEQDLGRILGYVDRLRRLSAESGPHASAELQALREDRPAPGLSREEALSPAAQTLNGFFLVPAVLGGGEDPRAEPAGEDPRAEPGARGQGTEE